jgi:hypothetical protein
MKSKYLDVEKFKLYPYEKTMGKSDLIPDKKGIYAWYIDFSKFKNFDTKEEFSKKIKLLDSLIASDTMKGNVKSFFKNYNVQIDENRLFIDKYIVDDTEEELIFGEKLVNLSIEDCKNMMDLLSNFSILVNPLYVGISSSLKTRWDQHKKSFNKIKELQDLKEDDDLIKNEAMKSFGGRIALKGFNWDYLVFACVEKDIDRKIINETEYLINRFYNPLFGRR